MASRLRSGLLVLTRGLSTDLSAVWRQVETAAGANTALQDILPALIDQYGSAAGVMAAEWYDDLRAKRGVGGSFRAEPVDLTDTGTAELLGYAKATATDFAAFQTLILGGSQRRMANFSRLTVMQSSVADPQARGWYRVGDGSTCPFCSMLLGRGAVYSEASADFQAHDHCGCTASPEFA